jgi:hypothetical protein
MGENEEKIIPLNGKFYIIFAADVNQISMTKTSSRNSVLTGSFLEHIKKNQSETFPKLLKNWN